MKRALGLILMVAACLAGLFLIWGYIPVVLSFLVFLVILVIAIFLYAKELTVNSQRLSRKLVNPVIQEYYNANLVLLRRFQATEAALDKFASSMELYTHHLDSHTSAIQRLSDVSSELKESAFEQNRVITHILQIIEYNTRRRDISRPERVVHEPEKSVRGGRIIDKPGKATKMEEGVTAAGIFPVAGAQSHLEYALDHKVSALRKGMHD